MSTLRIKERVDQTTDTYSLTSKNYLVVLFHEKENLDNPPIIVSLIINNQQLINIL